MRIQNEWATWNDIVGLSSTVSLSSANAVFEAQNSGGGVGSHAAAMAQGAGMSFFSGWSVQWNTGPGYNFLSYATSSNNIISTSQRDVSGRIHYNNEKGSYGRYVQVNNEFGFVINQNGIIVATWGGALCVWVQNGQNVPKYNQGNPLLYGDVESLILGDQIPNQPNIMDDIGFGVTIESTLVTLAAEGNYLKLVQNIAKGTTAASGVFGMTTNIYSSTIAFQNGNIGDGYWQATQAFANLVGTALLFTPFAGVGVGIIAICGAIDIIESLH